MFGNINKEQTAKQVLGSLKQKGVVTAYITKFQQHAFKTEQNNDFLKAVFYKGLKDSMKDDMFYIKKKFEML